MKGELEEDLEYFECFNVFVFIINYAFLFLEVGMEVYFYFFNVYKYGYVWKFNVGDVLEVRVLGYWKDRFRRLIFVLFLYLEKDLKGCFIEAVGAFGEVW